MTESGVNGTGFHIRRSPPVLISRTVGTIIPIPGCDQEIKSVHHEHALFVRHGNHGNRPISRDISDQHCSYGLIDIHDS